VRRLTLRVPQAHVTRSPPPKRWKVEAAHDGSIDVLQHHDFGEHELLGGVDLELADCLIRDPEELVTTELILEVLDALQNELLVLLSQ
jgi:hypothetical protein